MFVYYYTLYLGIMYNEDDAYELQRLRKFKNKFDMWVIIYGTVFSILGIMKIIDYFIPFLPLI